MRAILACRAHRPYCFARLSAAAFVPTQPSHTGRRPQRRAATDWSPFLRGSAPRRPLRELAVRAMEVSLDPVTFPTIRLGKEAEGDMVVIGVYEEDFKVDGSDVEIGSEGLKELDGKYGGALSDVVLEKGFKGKRGSCGVVREGKEVRYVGMVGLGSKEKLSVESDWGKTVFEDVGGQVANHAKTLKVKKASVVFVEPLSGAVGVMGGKIALGVWLGGYEITRFKAEPKISPLEDLALVLGCEEEEFAPEIARAETVARGVILARSLVETPANICTPQYMADTAKMIADEFPDVMKLKVLEKEECEERKMGLYLAVARGSALPPKFIHLTYTPSDGQVDKKIALVGKGLSFDSGGYNIKMAMMELMKLDMGGASATLGAAKIIGALKPKGVEIHFIIAACENMIASDAYRPGDVITASNGKTVEIINTDAEGRLTLADALVYAQVRLGFEPPCAEFQTNMHGGAPD